MMWRINQRCYLKPVKRERLKRAFYWMIGQPAGRTKHNADGLWVPDENPPNNRLSTIRALGNLMKETQYLICNEKGVCGTTGAGRLKRGTVSGGRHVSWAQVSRGQIYSANVHPRFLFGNGGCFTRLSVNDGSCQKYAAA